MKRLICICIVCFLICGLFSACSIFPEAQPFPGLGVPETSMTEVSLETTVEPETEIVETTLPEETHSAQTVISQESLEQQLQLLLSCSDLWEYTPSSSEICSYCVTDLDRNGRIEIIMSSFSNSGYNSYTECMEVNEKLDGLDNCLTSDLVSDIMLDETLACYSDSKVFCYATMDTAQTIWQETVQTRYSMKLEKGKLTEEKLASVSNTSSLTPSDIESAFTDAHGNPISQTDYEMIYDTQYSGWKKTEVELGWIGGNYSIPSMEMLRSSYETFAAK